MSFTPVSHANTAVFTIGSPQSGVSERIRLTGGALVSANTVTITFQTSTGNTAVSGAMTLIAGVPLVLPASPADPCSGKRHGYLQSGFGDSLQFTLGGSVQVSGFLEYVAIAE